jgi:bifunctional DNase/RNase
MVRGGGDGRLRGGQLLLVLGEKHGARRLPVPVSKAEAELIERARGEPRGLLPASLDALGGRVLGASLDEVGRDRSVRGHLSLARGSRELRLDASAGEALALALQAGAPIAADPDLLDEAGISPDDLLGQRARNLRRVVEAAPVHGL